MPIKNMLLLGAAIASALAAISMQFQVDPSVWFAWLLSGMFFCLLFTPKSGQKTTTTPPPTHRHNRPGRGVRPARRR
jgi:hypothetical protein